MKTVMIFTRNTLEMIMLAGGCGNWRGNKQRLGSCKYLIITQNKIGLKDKTGHGNGFLIGKVSGIRRTIEDKRYLIQLSEYAEIDIPSAWPGNRNPIAYLNVSDLEKELPVNGIQWKPFFHQPLPLQPHLSL